MRPYRTLRFYDDMMPRKSRARRTVRRTMKHRDNRDSLKEELLVEQQAFDAETKEIEDYERQFDSECGPDAEREYWEWFRYPDYYDDEDGYERYDSTGLIV